MKKITCIFWLFSIALIALGSPIEPCYYENCKCDRDARTNATQVICENMDKNQPTGKSFPKRIGAPPNSLISDFLVANYDFPQITDNSLDGLSIDSFYLLNNSMRKLTKNTFSGVPGLTSFYVSEESQLETIEAGTFDPITGLRYLELSKIGLSDSKFEAVLPELSKLNKLRTLSLESNLLTTIGPKQFSNLSTLYSLYLNRNQLTKFDLDALSGNPLLISFGAADNKLSNLKEIFKAFQPAQNIRDINLKGNLITSLATDTPLPTLASLRLENNLIESFDNQSLIGTDRLYYLYLFANKLSYIEDARLQKMSALTNLYLSNNYLTKVPSIFKLTGLSILDISFQNGKLKSIHDYAFERESIWYNTLKINLDGNDIDTFGKQAFCSRYYVPSYISEITFSYKTMKTIPICVLKQLGSQEANKPTLIKVSNSTELVVDYSNFCNCSLLSSVKLYNINSTGVFDGIFATLNCNHTAFQDPCVNQTQYECVASLAPTTTTTTTTRRTTTSNSSSKMGCFNLSLAFFLSYFFL